MLQLIKSKETREINGVSTPVRIYKNTLTGSELTTYLLRQDQFNNTWWTFEDLFTLPFIRQLAAKKVLDLYGNGLSLEDVKSLTAQIKTILKSTNADKIDVAYAKVLELENLSEIMADPVKQCMGLVTVYVLLNDEQPDAYTNQVTSVKMTTLAMDVDSQAFFLNWWIGIMKLSGQALKGLSRIASTAKELSDANTPAPLN